MISLFMNCTPISPETEIKTLLRAFQNDHSYTGYKGLYT